jgi:hypothetical protein
MAPTTGRKMMGGFNSRVVARLALGASVLALATVPGIAAAQDKAPDAA